MFDRTTTLTIPAPLVPYVRSGLIAEFGSGIDVLEATLAADVVNHEAWRAGLAQLDCARGLLGRIELAPRLTDRDVTLELSPASARMLLDSMRAIYDVEVQRLSEAASDCIHLPLRDVPTLRNFVVDAEKRLGRIVKRQARFLGKSDKRSPRSVRARRPVDSSE